MTKSPDRCDGLGFFDRGSHAPPGDRPRFNTKISKSLLMMHHLIPVRHIFLTVSLFLGGGIALTALEPLQASPTPTVTEDSRADRSDRKPRIAILNFDLSQVFDDVNSTERSKKLQNIASGISDIVAKSFVDEGSYLIVGHSRVNALLAERGVPTSEGVSDTATIAEIGRALGVDAIFVGSVTQFERHSTRDAAIFPRYRNDSVLVKLNGKLVNPNTSEVITTVDSISRKGRRYQQGGITIEIGPQGKLVRRSRFAITEQQQELFFIAMQEAAARLASSTPTPRKPLDSPAKIVELGSDILVDRGANFGFQEGMVVGVKRLSEEIMDPSTGEVLHRIFTEVGRLRLYRVGNSFSYGRKIPASSYQVGDIVYPLE